MLFDSSGSDNKGSVSSCVEVVFCGQGVANSLFVSNLERIREKYQLPDSFSLVVLFGDAHHRQPGFMTLYEDTLIAGLRLSLHPLVREVLMFLSITPDQLAPNTWRFFMGVVHR